MRYRDEVNVRRATRLATWARCQFASSGSRSHLFSWLSSVDLQHRMAAPPNPFKLTLRLGQQATAPSPLPQQLASSAASVATLSPASEFDDPMNGTAAVSASEAGSIAAGTATTQQLPRATLGQAPLAGVGSVAPSVVAAGGVKAAAAAAGAKVPGEKPKRKRAPKRPPGEPGPGKAWRKGLKGLSRVQYYFTARHRT